MYELFELIYLNQRYCGSSTVVVYSESFDYSIL